MEDRRRLYWGCWGVALTALAVSALEGLWLVAVIFSAVCIVLVAMGEPPDYGGTR